VPNLRACTSPMSNSQYGWHSLQPASAFFNKVRAKPSCPEVEFAEFTIKNKIPYEPNIRFSAHGGLR